MLGIAGQAIHDLLQDEVGPCKAILAMFLRGRRGRARDACKRTAKCISKAHIEVSRVISKPKKPTAIGRRLTNHQREQSS